MASSPSLHRPLRSGLRTPVLAVALTTLAALVALPTPLATAAVSTPTVDTVTTSPSSVTLVRKNTAPVTVTLHLVSPTGQQASFGSPARNVPAVVDRGHAVDFARTALTLKSGTSTDGVWQATLTAGSMMNGAHPLAVELCPVGRDCVANGPVRLSLARTVTVNGSDWPVLGRTTQKPSRLSAGDTTGAKAVGRVVFSQTRAPARGVQVVVKRKPAGTGVVVDRSNRKGAFTAPWPWPSPDFATLELALPGVPGVRFGRHLLGFPATTFAVRVTHAPAVASLSHLYTVTGVVTPGTPARRLGAVVLEIRRNGHWRIVDRSPLRPITGAGASARRAHFTLTTSIDTVGRQLFRVRKPAALCAHGRCRVAEGRSRSFDVITGNRAYFVERKLARLHVPVGSVDGVVDARTRQALCAWRDMSGRAPNRNGLTPGVVDSVLRAHRLPRPDRSDGLYVNQTCQILFQVVDHAFRRVVWASSGMPGYETPNGTGAVFRKIEGPVESTLYPGAFMYHPMFFFTSRPAIALHGSATNDLVLPYPASHGCVRVWRPDIFRIFKETPLGTKVQVYGKY